MLLTLERLHWLRESPLSTGYWCETTAYSSPDNRTIWLGSARTPTPRLALRWLRHRTEDLLDQLDTATTWPAQEWLRDYPEHDRALSALRRGEMYTLAMVDGTVRYTLSARPTGSAE